MIKVGSDFSGVGAFIQALIRLEINFKEIFACDMDKYARETYLENYDEPIYFPENVYDREIPNKPLDIYMTSPPCQAFSLAGKRKGESDDRGILFYNSHEFIQKNKPRYFIFENVKGLLSDDKKNKKDEIGRTFRKWLDYLGGKSVNGNPVLFPHEKSVPYHIYYEVMNAKEHGVPQNRERVFIIGIREDSDNYFRFPKTVELKTKLIDILEDSVDEKYFLDVKSIEKLVNKRLVDNDDIEYINVNIKNPSVKVSKEVRTEEAKAERRQTGTNSYRGKQLEFRDSDVMNCISTSQSKDNLIKVVSANKKGYEEAKVGDSVNLVFPESKTRRGRVGEGVAQTLDTSCNQGVIIDHRGHINKEPTVIHTGVVPCLRAESHGHQPKVVVGTWRTHKDGQGFREMKDNVSPTIPARAREDGSGQPVIMWDWFIRRLTPRECFRLMDFNDEFTWSCSDTQAYKQAGNSIVVKCLELIIKQFNLK